MFFMFLDSGQPSTPSTFFTSISIPLGPMMTPRNSIFFAFYTHFSGLTYRLFFFSLFSISSTILSCPSSVSVPTSTSSINTVTFPLFIKSLKILFIITWNIAGKFIIPKNITVGSKKSMCIVNTLCHKLHLAISPPILRQFSQS